MTRATRHCTSATSPACSETCSDCVAVTAGAHRSTSDIASWLGRGHCKPLPWRFGWLLCAGTVGRG